MSTADDAAVIADMAIKGLDRLRKRVNELEADKAALVAALEEVLLMFPVVLLIAPTRAGSPESALQDQYIRARDKARAALAKHGSEI